MISNIPIPTLLTNIAEQNSVSRISPALSRQFFELDIDTTIGILRSLPWEYADSIVRDLFLKVLAENGSVEFVLSIADLFRSMQKWRVEQAGAAKFGVEDFRIAILADTDLCVVLRKFELYSVPPNDKTHQAVYSTLLCEELLRHVVGLVVQNGDEIQALNDEEERVEARTRLLRDIRRLMARAGHRIVSTRSLLQENPMDLRVSTALGDGINEALMEQASKDLHFLEDDALLANFVRTDTLIEGDAAFRLRVLGNVVDALLPKDEEGLFGMPFEEYCNMLS